MFPRMTTAPSLTCLGLASGLLACSPADSASHQLVAPSTSSVGPDEIGTGEIVTLHPDVVRSVFIMKCMEGGGPVRDGEAGSRQDCEADFDKTEAAMPAAEALIRAFQPSGAVSAGSLEELRITLPQVRWTEDMTGGSTVASGKLGLFDVAVARSGTRRKLSFNWSGRAGIMPVDVAYALTTKADLTLIACYGGAADETGRAWRVTPIEGQPFNLVTFSRVGPSGTALSTYSASAPLDRQPMTLASLRAEDSDWSVCG